MNEQLQKLMREANLSVWSNMPKAEDTLNDLRSRILNLAPNIDDMSREQIVNAVVVFAMDGVSLHDIQSAVDRWKASHL